jgi:hypothetical protein
LPAEATKREPPGVRRIPNLISVLRQRRLRRNRIGGRRGEPVLGYDSLAEPMRSRSNFRMEPLGRARSRGAITRPTSLCCGSTGRTTPRISLRSNFRPACQCSVHSRWSLPRSMVYPWRRSAWYRWWVGRWRSLRGGEIEARIEIDVRLRNSHQGGLVLDASGDAIGMAVLGPRRVIVIPAATIERVAGRLTLRCWDRVLATATAH